MYLVEAISKANIDWNLNITILALARSREKLQKVFGRSLLLPYIHALVQDITEPIVWEGDTPFSRKTCKLLLPTPATEDSITSFGFLSW